MVRKSNFPRNYYFLPIEAYVCVRNIDFSGNFRVHTRSSVKPKIKSKSKLMYLQKALANHDILSITSKTPWNHHMPSTATHEPSWVGVFLLDTWDSFYFSFIKRTKDEIKISDAFKLGVVVTHNVESMLSVIPFYPVQIKLTVGTLKKKLKTRFRNSDILCPLE